MPEKKQKPKGFQKKNTLHKNRKAARRASERLQPEDGADSSNGDESAGAAQQPHDSQPSAASVQTPSITPESPEGDGARRSKRQRIARTAPEPVVAQEDIFESPPTRIVGWSDDADEGRGGYQIEWELTPGTLSTTLVSLATANTPLFAEVMQEYANRKVSIDRRRTLKPAVKACLDDIVEKIEEAAMHHQRYKRRPEATGERRAARARASKRRGRRGRRRPAGLRSC